MGHEGGLALFATFVAFGVVSISLYFLVLRPILPSDAPANTRAAATSNTPTSNRGTNRGRALDFRTATNNNTGNAQGTSGSSSIDKLLAQASTSPIHLAPSSQGSSRSAGGANLLVEGLLGFRHCRAAGYEQAKSTSAEVIAQNRKERARILSRMLTLEDATADSGNPPVRGSTIVASIPLAEVACPKLRRVLYMFATYFNLLVILVVPSGTSTSDLDHAKAQLRGGEQDEERLHADCLPDHRITAASTSAGRIAFVRQLGRVEILLDYDSQVLAELKRFGYRVINYKKHVSNKAESQLGSQLILS